MSDKFNLDDILDLGQYDYPEDSSFDLDDILGTSAPEIETETIPADVKTEKVVDKAPAVTSEPKMVNHKAPEIVPAEKLAQEVKEEQLEDTPAIAAPQIEVEKPVFSDVPVFVETPVREEEKSPDAEFSFVMDLPTEPLVAPNDDKEETLQQPKATEATILFDLGGEFEESEHLPLEVPADDILFADDSVTEETPLFVEPAVAVVDLTEDVTEEPVSVVKEDPKPEKTEFKFNVAAFDEVKAKSDGTKQKFADFVNPKPVEPAETPVEPEPETVETPVTDFVEEQPKQQEMPVKLKEEDDSSESQSRPRVIEEYSSIEEREDVLSGLKSLLNKITVKIVLMGVLFLGSVYLFLGLFEQFSAIVPVQISPLENPVNYCLVSLAVSVLFVVLNISPMLDSIKKLLHGRLTPDGVSLVLGFASVIYNLYFLLNPEKYAAVCISFDFFLGLSILMNLIAKRLLVKHIYCNFETISEEKVKAAIGRPKSSAVDNDVMVETGSGGDVLYTARTKTVSNYLNRAFGEENLNSKVDKFTFVLFAVIVFFGLTSWLFKLLPLATLVVMEMALVCVASVVFSAWSHTLYIYKLGVFLRRNNTMISGREGAVAMSDSGVLVVEDTDLISCDDIGLCGMQIKGGYNVTEILLALTSLFRKVGGPLDGFFAKILEDESDFEFPVVYEPYYHEQLGYTFSVNDSRMAVGNAEFMRELHIEAPELKQGDDVQMIYVVIDNALAGVFGVSYRVSAKSARALRLLEEEGISVAIISKDFNLREDTFASVVDDPEIITILSAETAEACGRCCGEVPKASADIVTYDRIHGMAFGLAGCNKLLSCCACHVAYRVTASIFGVMAVATIMLLGADNLAMLPVQILLYHVLWNLPNIFRALRIKI